MSHNGFELRGFSSTLLLEVLAELGPDLEDLWRRGMRGRVASSALGTQPHLFVPEEAVLQEASDDVQPSYQRLVELLRQLVPNLERQVAPLEDDPEGGSEDGTWRPLDQVLPQLLLTSGQDGDAARPEEAEWLVIDGRGDAEAAARLFEDLRFHATHCRIASVATQEGQVCHLVHLLADPKRKSSLGGFVAGEGLSGLPRLLAFKSRPGLPRQVGPAQAPPPPIQTLFLPQDRPPSRRGLDAYCRLLAAVPGIQGLGPEAASAPLLLAIAFDDAAVHDTEGEGRGEIYPLARLDFVDQADLAPGPSAAAELEVLRLKPSPAGLAELRRRILEARPRVGHRLELRPGYPYQGSDRELVRLVERLTDLEQRREYLESLQKPRPVLLRFAQHQLPALADALRCFPASEIQAGKIRYAFEATAANPGGWHYLLFDPGEAVQNEPYSPWPSWRWSELEKLADRETPQGGAMRFWLDPLWANHYYASASQTLVFVPRGFLLFPSLHSWRPEEMGVYLPRLLSQWFPGDPAAGEIPARGFYLFDQVHRRGDTQIRVQVLDGDGFAPLTDQIGWLNDNLALQHCLDSVPELFSRLASQDSRRRLDERFASEAQAAARSFEEAAHEANRAVSEGATELLQVMTEEIAAITRRCQEASLEIRELHRELAKAEAVLESLKRTDRAVTGALEKTEEAVGKNAKLIQELENQLAHEETRRAAIEGRVNRAMDDLEAREEELRRRLWQR